MATSCKRNDTSGFTEVPSYIIIKDITVQSDEQLHGAGTDQITDAWVFVDDDQIGVFELPCEIPVLKDGDRNIKIFGGIKRGGINSQRASYEFYDPYEIDTILTSEEAIELSPVVTYNSNNAFEWKENFEDISILVDSTTASDVAIRRISNPDIVRSGLYCGGMLLDAENSTGIFYTVDKITIPKFAPSYIEFDYKTNVELKISMQIFLLTGTIIPSEIITVTASDDAEESGWKKMYVYIAPGISANNDADQFQFYFTAELPSAQQSGYVYVDNLKVVF